MYHCDLVAFVIEVTTLFVYLTGYFTLWEQAVLVDFLKALLHYVVHSNYDYLSSNLMQDAICNGYIINKHLLVCRYKVVKQKLRTDAES